MDAVFVRGYVVLWVVMWLDVDVRLLNELTIGVPEHGSD